jgi:two-component system nitrate/nitrite response regulator NarL
MTIENKIRVLIANIRDIDRFGIITILSATSDNLLVGEANDGLEISEMVSRSQPNILLLDPDALNNHSLLFEKWMKKTCLETSVIIFSANKHVCYLSIAMERGVAGFINKNESVDKFIQSIHSVADGNILFSKEQVDKVNYWREEIHTRINNLTKREFQTLGFLCKGMSNRMIAKEMNLSIKTVETYMAGILRILQLTSRSEIICWCFNHLPNNWISDTRRIQ